ncbi:MAG: SMC family ATPase [Actinomycetota bacterium]
MRPVRIELEGFGTFRDRTEIDFDGLDLVAFVGPTGSGKSTVIDAMTFALYGSVARYDNTSLVAPVIHQLSTEAKVRFDFELAGRRHTAVRIVRRVKSSDGGAPRATTKEARLERVEGDDATTVLAGNVKELDAAIADLIGLDFHQFTRTIVLPQGDFAEFLTDDPGNRQKLLRRLLDLDIYARMGARARDVAKEAGQRARIHGEELERLSDADPARLAAATDRQRRLADFAAGLDDRLLAVAEVDTELAAKRDEVTAIDRALGVLANIVVPEGLVTADAVTSAALAALDEARAGLTAAQTVREEAIAALDAAGDPNLLRAAVARRREVTRLTEAVTALDAEHEATLAAQTDAATAAVEAEEAAQAGGEALRTARRSADAAEWVARLVAGEPCPICQQVVVDAPTTHGADELGRLERSAAAADRTMETARRERARLDGRVQSLAADLADRRKQLAAIEAEGADELAVTDEALAAAEAAATAADEAGRALRHAETTQRSAQAELDAARKAEAEYRAGFMGQRDAVVAHGAPTPEGTSLVDDWQALATWAATTTTTRSAQRAEIAAAGKTLAATKADLLATLTTAAEALGLPGDPGSLSAATAAAQATTAAEIQRIDEQRTRATELRARIADLEEARTVHDALGRQHLSAAGFERWLLAEALDHLVERATVRLRELSGGRYSLEAVEGSFAVRDHGNADERRDIRTLSGGEIFLASLSLALALAESIAELATVDGPRLESIFLDEGFGTLDVETLDILASAIEELSASGRLVGIVTHVRELAERMPVRFEVRKGATTSTVERVEG